MSILLTRRTGCTQRRRQVLGGWLHEWLIAGRYLKLNRNLYCHRRSRCRKKRVRNWSRTRRTRQDWTNGILDAAFDENVSERSVHHFMVSLWTRSWGTHHESAKGIPAEKAFRGDVYYRWCDWYRVKKYHGNWKRVAWSQADSRKTVDCRWVCKLKWLGARITVKYKARLVAQGFSLKFRQDNDVVITPVNMPTTLSGLFMVEKAWKKLILLVDSYHQSRRSLVFVILSQLRLRGSS